MKKSVLVALAAAACLAGPALAQQQAPANPPVGPDWSKIEVKTFDLGNRTYMLEGFGGNVTIAAGDDGVIMVDGQFAPMHDKLKAAIAAVTQQPVRFLVNTHYHRDHVGGNAPFSKDGAVVVAHENVRKRLAEGTTMAVPEVKYAPAPEEALPAITHKEGITLQVKGRAAQLKHPANAHTDGDTFVYFADANVVSTGDTVAIGRYPNIDFANGGGLKGMIAASDAYLALANDGTKIVPGHGPLASKAQLAEYRTMLSTVRDRMLALIKEGKSEADVLAAKPFADFDARLKANDQASTNWVRVVYASVKSE
ncbi:MAG TPA: MBL fold metallo-hydrolase [Pseudolabrys sp.]|jgi:glyoxylase-like metal-dependent hydrolase (beta-lactamase superfamily II)